MPAPMTLTSQRTIDLQSDVPDELLQPCPIPAVKSPKRYPTGGRWSWSDEEIGLMLRTSGEFDRCLIGPGSAWDFRISELLSLRVSDVMTEAGELRQVVTVLSEKLKGGKPPNASSTKAKPVDHVDGCKCKLCDPKPKIRRKPDDRSVPMGAAAPFIMARLAVLAKTRSGDGSIDHLDRSRFLFESRKRDSNGQSRPVSRQQGWYRVRQAMLRAGIDPTHHATHSLRKTSARKMMETSGWLDYVRDWLGHRSSATTDAYLRSDNTERLKMATAMGEFLRPMAEGVAA
jgi:integrase